jgi:hypothetical protein
LKRDWWLLPFTYGFEEIRKIGNDTRDQTGDPKLSFNKKKLDSNSDVATLIVEQA